MRSPARPGSRRSGAGLALACHPLPCIAVTAFAAAYGWSVGLGARTALLAAAVLSGQLAIGWCNDWVDAARDRLAGRMDKPLARGQVDRRTVGRACVVAMAACVPLSLLLGAVPGVVHLVAVGSGLSYDVRLKSTLASPLPYLLSFGLLPAVATTALRPGHWPPVAVMVAAALLGGGAHFANTVGDTEADRRNGIRGLPQLIGPRWSLVLTAALVAAAAAVMLAAASDRGALSLALLGGGAALAAAGGIAGARLIGSGRLAFRSTLVAVALVIAGFLDSVRH